MYNPDVYLPRIAKIEKISKLSPDSKLLRISFVHKEDSLSAEEEFLPGQFVQVSAFGVGEVPLSISSSPLDSGYLELTIRKVGKVTSALHRLKEADLIGIRGPFGNSFPLDNNFEKFIYIGGGCGIAPLRSLLKYMLQHHKKFPQLVLLYGAQTMENLLFKDEIYKLRDEGKVEVYLSVESGPVDAGCELGVVTQLLRKFDDLSEARIFVCGPPKMIHFTIKELIKRGAKEEEIILSLERYMKCGIGKCGHCYLKDKYVCTDGPIFSYAKLKRWGVNI